MQPDRLAEILLQNPNLVVHVVNASDEVLMHAKNLLYALDHGFLNYKADETESAFISKLREAIARTEIRS